ncbi:MAG: hypothetical protein OHK0012_07820 [Synechococcales cyanobacterium]
MHRRQAPPSPLQMDSLVQDLILYEESVQITEPGQAVYDLFKRKILLPGILVTDGQDYVGMIPRQRFYEHITSRIYSMDVFRQRPVQDMLTWFQDDILVISGLTRIADAAQLSLQRASQRIYEPIVVLTATDQGSLAQLLDVHQLLLAQGKIYEVLLTVLGETQTHLVTLNAELEQRVAQRTQEWQVINSNLRQEIEQRQALQEKLHQLAYVDPLTRLPNHAQVLEWLTAYLRRQQGQTDKLHDQEDSFCALLILDCDHFRRVNESLGHRMGDHLLQAIAARLQAAMRPQDMLARVGEDEFVVICPDVISLDTLLEIVRTLQQVWVLPFRLGSQEVFISASMGIVTSQSYTLAEDMLRDGDSAMYAAKTQQHGSWRLFEPTMHHQAQIRLQMETDLRRALDRQEFRVLYQPIINLQTRRLAGFEALVRWQHPQKGLVDPAQFITAAEDNGLIIPLGYWVIQEATQQWQRWQDLSPHPLRMSINLSVVQLQQSDLVEQTERLLAGIPRQGLVFELTESIFLDPSQQTAQILHNLHHQSIQVCLDDFGTGYSSLSYLQRLPVSNLKIDRAFVRDLPDSSENLGIIKAILALADTLNMTVTAEGVESRQQAHLLQEWGCLYGQGFYFQRPLTAVVAETMVRGDRVWA